MAQLALAAMATGTVDCADEEIPLEPIADQNFNRRKVLDLQHELTRLQMLGKKRVQKAPQGSCLCHPLISFPFRHQKEIDWESLKACAQSKNDTLLYSPQYLKWPPWHQNQNLKWGRRGCFLMCSYRRKHIGNSIGNHGDSLISGSNWIFVCQVISPSLLLDGAW